jgi:hypothetical protein
MTHSLRWPIAVAVSLLVLGVLVLADASGALRVAAALWFLLACPGLALVPLLPDVPQVARPALVVAVSFALDTAVATTMLVAGSFSPAAGALVLASVCLAGCGVQALRWAQTRPGTVVRLHD